MSADKPISTQTNHNTSGTIITRARFVQGEINNIREHLHQGRGAEQSFALLASYDAEMTRLCAVPGVTLGLFADAEQAP